VFSCPSKPQPGAIEDLHDALTSHE
jgi:hypothetical protein